MNESNLRRDQQSSRLNDTPEITVIIPVYNEEENIPLLYRRLTDVLEPLMKKKRFPSNSYEIIFINDCSIDRSWDLIKDISNKDPRVRGISLSRNYGKHPAIIAGLDHARGQIIVSMDGDLQAQPEDIPTVIDKIWEGNNIVWAVAEDRDDSLIVKIGAKVFYWVMRKISTVNMPENTVIVSFDKIAADSIKAFKEKKRMPDCIYSDIGFKRATVNVEKKKRYLGRATYSFFRRIKLFMTGIISYSKIPLRFVSALGLTMAFFSFVLGTYYFIKKIFWNVPVSGFTTMILAITMFSGVQLISLGVIAEYLGIVFDEVKKRPIYIVSEITDIESRT